MRLRLQFVLESHLPNFASEIRGTTHPRSEA